MFRVVKDSESNELYIADFENVEIGETYDEYGQPNSTYFDDDEDTEKQVSACTYYDGSNHVSVLLDYYLHNNKCVDSVSSELEDEILEDYKNSIEISDEVKEGKKYRFVISRYYEDFGIEVKKIDYLHFDFEAGEMIFNDKTFSFDDLKIENHKIIINDIFDEEIINDFFDDEIETEYFNYKEDKIGFETVKIFNQDENEVVALRKNEVVYLDNELIDEMFNH
ncbi:MAG: hypothetical protein ACOC3V_04385 [bacterium]